MPNTIPTCAGRRREDAHLEEIERLTREFINYFDKHRDGNKPRDVFAPGTVKFVDHVRPLLDQLEDVRERRHRRRAKK